MSEQGNTGTTGSSAETRPAQDNAPQNRRRRKWPWVVGGIVAVVVLGGIVLIGVLAALLTGGGSGGGFTSAPGFQEEYVSGEGADRIAVIPVEGTIAPDVSSAGDLLPSTTPRGLADALTQAGEDPTVSAVILEINSPGGGVTASADMHDEILDFKRSSDKPVVVSMADTAASGGYYIATAADRIVAQETTLTGSLGVYLGLLNFSEAAEKYGITQEYVRSGEFKTMGDPFRQLSDDEREIFQSIVDENYNEFVDVIVEGRDLPESEVREIADGRIYSGLQARDLDLVDELGDLDTAVESTAELAGVDDPTVVRYVRQAGFGSLLMARFAPEPPEAVQIAEAAGVQFSGEPQYLYAPGAVGLRSN